ncbi:MAG: hypothetical protein M3N30_02780 [Bacteroidota bacterium]|nr:hypothetical protein [Bacteroidota bacterium]
MERTDFTGKEKSVAVLPLANLSGDKANEYFSDGMTDEIINQLSKITGLRIISRGSVIRYKGSKEDIQQIAGELHVAALLKGGINRSGNKLKINIRLIDVNTGKPIWEEDYDREISDIFSIQTELAQLIADKLNAALTPVEKNKIAERPTQNLEAFDQYLKGRNAWNTGGDSALRKGIDFFNQAIRLDPLYSRAYSGLADCYSALGYLSYELPSHAFLKAEAAAVKALQLDSTLADPHTSLGYIKFYYYWDWVGAEQEFLKAIHLNPAYVLAYDSYGYFLTAMERFPEGRSVLEKAWQLDPLSPKINTDLGFNLYYSHKYDQAITALYHALELNPKFLLAHLWLSRVYLQKKIYREAIEQNLITLKGKYKWAITMGANGYIYAVSGNHEEAKKILSQMYALSDSQYITPYGLGIVYAGMNDTENAFKCLNKAYTDRSNWLVWFKQDPRWASIKNDKRYIDLVKKIGLPDNALPLNKQ